MDERIFIHGLVMGLFVGLTVGTIAAMLLR